MQLIILGPPASGKGTQARLLQERRDLTHVDTGALIRTEADSSSTGLGREAREAMARGELLPDRLVWKIVQKRLEELAYRAYVLDGYPRTRVQARYLGLCSKVDLDVALWLEVPDEILKGRIRERMEEEDRPDDRPEAVERRIQNYHAKTEPVRQYFEKRGLLESIDAVGSIEEVYERIVEGLEAERTHDPTVTAS